MSAALTVATLVQFLSASRAPNRYTDWVDTGSVLIEVDIGADLAE